MTQTFTIDGRLPGLNEIINVSRGNKWLANRMKQDNTQLVLWTAKAANIKPLETPAHFHFIWREPNKKRDPDNITAGMKFIFDGLVAAAIMKNDGWKEVKSISHEFIRVEKSSAGVKVEILENGGQNPW